MHGANLIKVKILRFGIAQYFSRAEYLTGIILLSRKETSNFSRKYQRFFEREIFKSGTKYHF